MKYTVRYAAELPRATRDAMALRDIREYLGEDRWRKLNENFFFPEGGVVKKSDRRDWFRAIRFALSFAGVEGYPVRAYLRAFWLCHGKAK